MIFLKILLIVMGLMVINAILIQTSLDEKTKGKNFDIYDQSGMLFIFMFFGIFTLPFMNQIKKYRKILYLKKRLNELKNNKAFILFQEAKLNVEDINQEILFIERLLKLERLKRKV